MDVKQDSRSWNIQFDHEIKDFGFMRNPYESCLYNKVNGSAIAFLILYVDDILIILMMWA